MEDLRDRVSRVIARQFHVANERITETATLEEDLGATSLDRVEVVMSLEDEFKIDISDDQASRLHTVADILACVTASVGKGGATASLTAR
jgi:acyl carrier protein